MWTDIDEEASATPSAEAPRAIRVLIADDHALVRFGLSALLSGHADIEVVGEATNGRDAVDMCAALRPDVVLMDLQMPVLSGFDSIVHIRSTMPNCRILVVTTFSGDAQITRALKAGAAGYLLKATLRTELLDAIRITYHDGQRQLSAEVAMTLANSFDSRDLAPRETEVLRLVAEGNSNKHIARELAISEETVKCYMKTIFAKLGARDRAHAVTIALRRGIIEL
jgi:two-component system, NarL family, response regulator